jgi:hypothetical protein
MHPSDYSKRIAHAIIKLYESTLPSVIRPLFTSILISFMGPRLRAAMALDSQTKPWVLDLFTTKLLPFALSVRKHFVRHCMLPRKTIPTVFMPSTRKDGRTHAVYWQMLPHYAPVTLWNKWGPHAVYCRLFGLNIPGEQWKSQGYKIEEVGYGGRGSKRVLEVLENSKRGGCPYSTFGKVSDERELGGIFAKYGSCPTVML